MSHWKWNNGPNGPNWQVRPVWRIIPSHPVLQFPVKEHLNFRCKIKLDHPVVYHCVYTRPCLADKPGVKGEDFAYPGLAQPQQGDEKIYHAYYQWVPFVLLLQGMLFYFPHWLWKTLEDRKLDKITNGLRGTLLRQFVCF